MEKNLKRDNWTTEEVMKIVEGCKIVQIEGKYSERIEEYNMVIDNVINQFYDFQRPLDDFGAMAYCPEEDMIYHVGSIPTQ